MKDDQKGRTILTPGRLNYPDLQSDLRLRIVSSAHDDLARTVSGLDRDSLKVIVNNIIDDRKSLGSKYLFLSDDLIDFIPGRIDVPDLGTMEKTLNEFDVYRRLIKRDLLGSNYPGFANLAMEINASFDVGPGEIRTRSVQIAPDANLVSTLFPPPRECTALLQEVERFLLRNLASHPSVCAMAAYVALIHAHPFVDGNGRTARTMYNLIMFTSGCGAFLPIMALNQITAGALIIKLRRAYLGGEWQPLQAFFLDGLRCINDLTNMLRRPSTSIPAP